ncbi:LytTR family DNA-binding domain-containing protein [Rhizobium sp. C4]|uniref:LytTR family DNA-binding domain-containing protein n=1 Tax=Rhizobium sp. C4 TaxID=1349800 RepID=UPI001E37EDFD|nr:LytTR family DNA-binding domain-containing protein [Rhizobium sp. C4]MCD2175938.1 LytTR family transcriptional regulator [Rhizobium sp. C4]
MNGGKLHSALRELQDFASSRNFWIVLAAIVLLFTAIGPFGTDHFMGVLPRFGFWLVNMFVGTWIAIVFVVFAELYLDRFIARPFARMFVGSLLSCPVIGLTSMLVVYSWRGPEPSWARYLENTAQALPIGIVFTLIFWASMRHEKQIRLAAEGASPDGLATQSALAAGVVAESREQKAISEPPPLLSRLKPENRAPILRLSAEDHYTHTVTTRGRELILIRFSDALSELGDTVGTQIHRSHWIACAAFDALLTKDGKLMARLKDGTELPVSRSFASEVRAKVSSWS